MKVFVAGGTGVVGRTATAAMVAAGHRVSAVARTPEKADELRGRGVEPLTVDLFDPEAVRDAVQGFDVICNLTTHIPSLGRIGRRDAWRENDRIRREVSANLTQAAIAAGVGRVIQESVLFVYPDAGEEWVTESVAPAPVDYVQSALEAEANAARHTEQGGTGVVLRFAQFYGPHSGQTREMLGLARRWRIAPAAGSRDGWMASLHEEDAGSAVLAALTISAGIWNVGDEPVRRSEWVAALAGALDRRLAFGGKLLVPFMGVAGAAVSRSIRLSSSRFQDAAGWNPRYASVREGWPAVTEALGSR